MYYLQFSRLYRIMNTATNFVFATLTAFFRIIPIRIYRVYFLCIVIWSYFIIYKFQSLSNTQHSSMLYASTIFARIKHKNLLYKRILNLFDSLF